MNDKAISIYLWYYLYKMFFKQEKSKKNSIGCLSTTAGVDVED